MVDFYLTRFACEMGEAHPQAVKGGSGLMTHYGWPGNVRELRNICERLIVLSDTTEIGLREIQMLKIFRKKRPYARRSDTGKGNGPAGNRDCVCQFEAQEEKTGYSEGAGGQQDDPVAHGENGAGTEEAMMPGYISIDRKSFGRYAYNIRKNQKNKVERWRHEDSTD